MKALNNGDYYKLLVMFNENEKITRKRLLRMENQGINEVLIYSALELGLIEEADMNDINEIRYRITDKGKEIRDN